MKGLPTSGLSNAENRNIRCRFATSGLRPDTPTSIQLPQHGTAKKQHSRAASGCAPVVSNVLLNSRVPRPFPTCRAHREDGLPSVHTREKWQAIFRCADKSGRGQQRTPRRAHLCNLRLRAVVQRPRQQLRSNRTFLAEKQLSARFLKRWGHEPQKDHPAPGTEQETSASRKAGIAAGFFSAK